MKDLPFPLGLEPGDVFQIGPRHFRVLTVHTVTLGRMRVLAVDENGRQRLLTLDVP